ncbi:hypothetical protein [Neobacillus sp. SAB-20_R2A]|uniref:hypothetical protein n=1 Tax=Neobacillus sp. SAB-20_R2A TaxID=3120519 RepID=UPI003C6E98A2
MDFGPFLRKGCEKNGKRKKKHKATPSIKKQNSKPKVKKTILDIALENVESVFREAEKAGLAVKKAKMRKSTYDSYQKSMITMLDDLAKMKGPDFKRLLPRYMNGKPGINTLNT